MLFKFYIFLGAVRLGYDPFDLMILEEAQRSPFQMPFDRIDFFRLPEKPIPNPVPNGGQPKHFFRLLESPVPIAIRPDRFLAI
ncbi:hypothetical protein SLA2020_281050 [Shorea laevis]